MTAGKFGMTAGAVMIAAMALAGCGSSGGAMDTAAAVPTRDTAAPDTTGPGAAAEEAPAQEAPAQESAAPAATGVGPGGRCDIGRPSTQGLVVGGVLDCDTLSDVWSRAVADPAFPTHGNRNMVTVDEWICRAHQTRPVQTGYCENPATQSRFKVIHT